MQKELCFTGKKRASSNKFFFKVLLLFVIFGVVASLEGCSFIPRKESSKDISKVQEVSPPPKGVLLEKASEVVEKWYELSDENNRAGLVKLLSSHWRGKKNQRRLKELLADWTFTPEEQKKGYRAVTRRKKIISQRVIESSYGELAIIEVEVEFEVWNETGHHVLKGINTFGLIWSYENGKWEPRIRTVEWRQLEKKST